MNNKLDRNTKIYIIVMTSFILVGVICGIIAMYMCGYTLASWLAKFYPWLIIGFLTIAIIAIGVYIMAVRKKL